MKIHLIFLFLGIAYTALGQEYSYTHYGTREGLAGSTVYCMVQDKEGFLWFGTEAGLSRFDGTNFKNFTKEDGLPDNEIMQLFTDSRGRVWIAPFKNAICYYYKGKIYNADNDALVKRIAVEEIVLRFAEDKKGNILFMEKNKLHLLKANEEIVSYKFFGNEPFRFGTGVSRNLSDDFFVIANNKVYELVAGKETIIKDKSEYDNENVQYVAISENMRIWRSAMSEVSAFSFLSGKSFKVPYSHTQLSMRVIDKRQFAMLTTHGATIYDVENPGYSQKFLSGIPVSYVLRDYENSLWFCTLGQGILRLNSEFVLNVRLNENRLPSLPVLTLEKSNDLIIAGSNNWAIYGFSPKTGKSKPVLVKYIDWNSHTPITALLRMGNGDLIYGSTNDIARLNPDFKLINQVKYIPVKTLSEHSRGLLAATSDNVLLLDPVSFAIKDTLWPSRATTVFNDNDTICIGSLNGLYRILPDRAIKYMGDISPIFKNRVTAIRKSDDGTLWIATYDEGVIGWKNNRILARLTVQNGLTSNMCYSVFLQGNYLWIGTNKGVNKIDISKKEFPVRKYTTGGGLLSDIINAIYVTGTEVYLGTPEGLTYFDEQKIDHHSHCSLQITGIVSSDQNYRLDNRNIILPHQQNNIRVDYAGISFKSAGDIRYRYRIIGLDSAWKETRETYLSYPALPSGGYELELQAINKFDVLSNIKSVKFTIGKSIWEKTWFKILLVVVFLLCMSLLVAYIARRIRRQEERKTATARRIRELEQLALKAQMNPHFIFNSLNSIQHYVMDKDIEGANKFISSFSRLIRQTLDFSSKQLISLEAEISYLSTYLELENMRFENNISWSITISPGVYPAEVYIPPMIFQPFIENSLRHGIRNRRDKNGKITIGITKENNYLVCILEDNGIGRKAAKQLKSNLSIEYQSKGMSLTTDRIAMLNKDNDNRIGVRIDDQEDGNGNSLGTRVTVSFPIGLTK